MSPTGSQRPRIGVLDDLGFDAGPDTELVGPRRYRLAGRRPATVSAGGERRVS